MNGLKEKLKAQIPPLREMRDRILKGHATAAISEVTVAQIYGGLRGVKGLVCDTSVVDPDKGLIVREIPVGDLAGRFPEEIFWLLLTGELPSESDLASLQQDLRARAAVPDYLWNVIEAMPADSHPMATLSAAILSLERESVFRRRYAEGMRKEDYWEAALEDSLALIAKLPAVAAAIYRRMKGDRSTIASDPKLDWGADYAHMLGVAESSGEFADLMRLYLTIHCDHEGGNVSAFSCHVVGSALSDPYYAVTAGLNGLAGPLHGLANQESLHFVLGIREKFGGAPGDTELSEYLWARLNSGQVIPGYGHAVLRVTDPRFTAFHHFGEKHCKQEEMFKIVDRLFALTPGILKQQGRVKDPWPNVDAISGSLLYHYGLKEFKYYTALFGVSRALGMCAQLILNRAVGTPIFRPKSVSTRWLAEHVPAPYAAV